MRRFIIQMASIIRWSYIELVTKHKFGVTHPCFHLRTICWDLLQLTNIIWFFSILSQNCLHAVTFLEQKMSNPMTTNIYNFNLAYTFFCFLCLKWTVSFSTDLIANELFTLDPIFQIKFTKLIFTFSFLRYKGACELLRYVIQLGDYLVD